MPRSWAWATASATGASSGARCWSVPLRNAHWSAGVLWHLACNARMTRSAWATEGRCCRCRFYFAYCEAAFDARYIHNFQIVWAKSAQPDIQPSASQDLPKAVLGGTAAAADPFTQACPISRLVFWHSPVGRCGLTRIHLHSEPWWRLPKFWCHSVDTQAGLNRTPCTANQVLLAIYFFLAGCVVSQSRMLWVMPAASAVFACALAVTAATSSALSSSYRCGGSHHQYVCKPCMPLPGHG